MTIAVHGCDANEGDDVTCVVSVTTQDAADLVELRESLERRIDVSHTQLLPQWQLSTHHCVASLGFRRRNWVIWSSRFFLLS